MRPVLLAGCAVASLAAAAAPGDAAMRDLATKAGCAACHLEAPATSGWDKLLPLTPSWREIAARYRGVPGAEESLTRVVLKGTGASREDRHWKGAASIPNMPPQEIEATPAEARELVRWILSKGEAR